MDMCWVKSVWLTDGVDFNATPLTATFDSGMTMSSVSVPVMDDVLAEGGNETFDLMLIVSSSLAPAITAEDRNRATGVIIDTTSMCACSYVQKLLLLWYVFVVLVIDFEFKEYTVAESSGFVEIVVIISGGSSAIPIRVIVTAIEQSATGKEHIITWLHTVTGLDWTGLDWITGVPLYGIGSSTL